VPVPRILLKGVHKSVEVGQFVQLSDIIPVGVCKPTSTWVIHLALPIQDLVVEERGERDDGNSSKEELLVLNVPNTKK
jgi:hypothetical protein